MQKVVRFVYETAYGPFVAWCFSALLLFAVYAISPPLGRFGTAMVNMMVIVQVITAIVNITALFKSLVEHQHGRALGQFFLGLAGLFLFGYGLAFAFVVHGVVAHATSSGYAEVRSANMTNETATLEFAVEYRPAHPFLAEYDKCVVFPSGKRIGVCMDTGGAGAFAVYRLPTGEYYLVDGLEHDFIRNDYRVNTTNETVEMMCDETWVKIPDDSLGVTSGGVSTYNSEKHVGITVKTEDGEKSVDDGTPLGDSLKGRVYVGLLYPRGKFEPGDGDPFADIIEPKWNPVKLDGGAVPFTLECKRLKGAHHYRLAFASGARLALDSTSCIGEGGYSLCALEDGRYHLFEAQKKDVLWRNEWRIDAAGEAVEVMFKDHWGKHGDLWVKIPNGATSANGSIGVSGGENGKPICVSIDVNTESGKVTGHDFIPVGDSLSGAKFIGTFLPPDNSPIRTQTVCGDLGHGEESATGLPPEDSDTRNVVRQPSSINVLYWLREQQAEDGGWGDVAGERVAVTSLATLAFLVSGEYPGSNSGNNQFGLSANDHPVAKACGFLSRCDQLKRTDLKRKRPGESSLNLPLAAFALAETYGMTKNPNVKESAQRLLSQVVDCEYDSKDGESRNLTMWSALALRAAKYARIEVDGRDESLERLENALAQFDSATLGYYGDLLRFRTAFRRYAERNDEVAWVEWKKGIRKTFRDSFVETGKTSNGIRLGYCKFPSESPDSTGFGAVADSALVVMKDEIGGNGRRNLPVNDNSPCAVSTNVVDRIAVEVDI